MQSENHKVFSLFMTDLVVSLGSIAFRSLSSDGVDRCATMELHAAPLVISRTKEFFF